MSDVLRHNVEHTRSILGKELEIQLGEVREQLHFASLERIFIEERIYKDKEYEESENREQAIAHIHRRLEPWAPKLIRPVTDEDIIRLFEIKMGRILKFNSRKSEEQIAAYLERIEELNGHLAHLTEYTIDWYKRLKSKYGASYPRLTQIRSFDNIQAATVAEANEKLYINREEGFIGTSLKKDEFLCNCSSIDDVIIFDSLDRDAIFRIIDIELAGFFRRTADMGYIITLTDSARNFIASKGCDVQFGARPLKRAIQKYLEDELAELMLSATLKNGDEILVDYDEMGQRIVTQVITPSAQPQIGD